MVFSLKLSSEDTAGGQHEATVGPFPPAQRLNLDLNPVSAHHLAFNVFHQCGLHSKSTLGNAFAALTSITKVATVDNLR